MSLKGKTVFTIVYNYSDYDYSIIKIMEKLDDAYDYICNEEYYCYIDSYSRLDVFKPEDIESDDDEGLTICYIVSGEYNKFNLCQYHNISHYAIIPVIIC